LSLPQRKLLYVDSVERTTKKSLSRLGTHPRRESPSARSPQPERKKKERFPGFLSISLSRRARSLSGLTRTSSRAGRALIPRPPLPPPAVRRIRPLGRAPLPLPPASDRPGPGSPPRPLAYTACIALSPPVARRASARHRSAKLGFQRLDRRTARGRSFTLSPAQLISPRGCSCGRAIRKSSRSGSFVCAKRASHWSSADLRLPLESSSGIGRG
jgi:hypothetical protein